mmetsp:Transcript_114310/g.287328  ORF Transcript_114310/g.287328 Transcript_114310/m.287328 type:complete len:227 (-) Transcript_114310:241-921(-)
MGYLEAALVQTLLAKVLVLPDVQQSVQSYHDAASRAGLRVRDIDTAFVGAVFYNDGAEEPLLPEDRRVKAAMPELFQLVYLGDVGLDIKTFDTLDGAKEKMNSLEDVYGELGGIIFHDGRQVAERLELKYMQKSDFQDYLHRATQPPAPKPEPSEDALRTAVKDALLDRVWSLTRLAPEMGKLKKEYEARQEKEPEVVYGRPSEALTELAHLYPHLVRLGGCVKPQ